MAMSLAGVSNPQARMHQRQWMLYILIPELAMIAAHSMTSPLRFAIRINERDSYRPKTISSLS
jgi:transcriptional regulator GlxA family with amidase domain